VDYSHLLGTSSSIRLFHFATNTSVATREMAFFKKLRGVEYEKRVTIRWNRLYDNERASDLRLIDERVSHGGRNNRRSAPVAGDCCDCIAAEDVLGGILDRLIKESPPAHTGQ
jgi:hypothetical protein